MRAFRGELEPVADSDEGLKFEPSGEIRRVTAVEPIPELGPFDIAGSINATSTSTDNEITEIEMRTNQVGQFWIHPLSPVEIEVKQDGQQDFRYETAQQRAVLSPAVENNMTVVFVVHDDVPFFDITNPNTYGLQRSRIVFTGFKFLVSDEPVTAADVEGDPVSIPTERLERQTQRAEQATQSQPESRARRERSRGRSRRGGGR